MFVAVKPMPPAALPEGWRPASTSFFNFTPAQLRENGLPEDRESLRKKLKNIYSDGHGFVFCKGQFLHPDIVMRWVDIDPLSFTPMNRAAAVCTKLCNALHRSRVLMFKCSIIWIVTAGFPKHRWRDFYHKTAGLAQHTAPGMMHWCMAWI